VCLVDLIGNRKGLFQHSGDRCRSNRDGTLALLGWEFQDKVVGRNCIVHVKSRREMLGW